MTESRRRIEETARAAYLAMLPAPPALPVRTDSEQAAVEADCADRGHFQWNLAYSVCRDCGASL